MTRTPPLLEEAEIAVVGGGPAGAIAAFTLASQGHDVVLIDKHSFPREKACGDGLMASAVSFLGELGLGDALYDAHPIEGTRLVVDWRARETNRRSPLGSYGGKRGCCLPRLALDQALIKAAASSGARLLQGNVTTLIRRDERIAGVELMHRGRRASVSARHVVAADGATSRLRRQLAAPARRRGVASSYAVRRYVGTEEPIEPVFDVYVPLTDSLAGYGWVFPVSERVANVGVGYVTAPGMARPRPITDLLDWFLASLQRHGGSRFGSLQPVGPPSGAPIAINFSPDRCELDGVIFVGDAARTCDPITGEGIDEAMRSAHGAALALDRAIRRGNGPVGIGHWLSCSRPRLGQDSAMIARLGHELLKRRGSERPGPTARSDAPAAFFSTARAMLSAEVDHPSIMATPAGQMALCLELAEPLRVLGDRISEQARSKFILCSELIQREVCAGAGPVGALTLLASQRACHVLDGDRPVDGALAVELLRVFPKMLSCVMRGGRNEAEANNALAVMVSDFVLARASAAAAKLGPNFTEMLAGAIEANSEAVALFAQDKREVGCPARRYVQWARLGSGTNISLAATIGAHLARAQEDVVTGLGVMGENLGIAVQICEDILAMMRPDPITGRQPRRALEEGQFTLPVILAVREEPHLASHLLGERGHAEWDGVVDAIRHGRGLASAAHMCRQYANTAKEAAVAVAGHESPLAAVCDLPWRCLPPFAAAPAEEPDKLLSAVDDLRLAS